MKLNIILAIACSAGVLATTGFAGVSDRTSPLNPSAKIFGVHGKVLYPAGNLYAKADVFYYHG